MNRKATTALVVLALGTGTSREAWAWGATGHEWISGIAIERLPDSLPDFVRTTEAAAEIAVMGRELDRSKGTGKTHDAERDPGHWLSLADDGSVVGVLPLAELPQTREDYDTLLRARGFTQYRAGYLPYAIVDGWQQIAKDFAYWRAAAKGAETAATPEERAWFEADRRLREKLTLHDIGVWSHYAADAAQPMHVSVHFSGWGNFPNPSALYALERDGGLKPGDRRGIVFATARLAAGASAVRDMIVDAWRQSADTPVGYPMVNLRDIESGKVRVTRDLFGKD